MDFRTLLKTKEFEESIGDRADDLYQVAAESTKDSKRNLFRRFDVEDKKTGETKFVGATGTIGYRWMESEIVRMTNKQDLADDSYYISLVNGAKDTIGKYGDFEWFAS